LVVGAAPHFDARAALVFASVCFVLFFFSLPACPGRASMRSCLLCWLLFVCCVTVFLLACYTSHGLPFCAERRRLCFSVPLPFVSVNCLVFAFLFASEFVPRPAFASVLHRSRRHATPSLQQIARFASLCSARLLYISLNDIGKHVYISRLDACPSTRNNASSQQ
jgi:hypothetical protein